MPAVAAEIEQTRRRRLRHDRRPILPTASRARSWTPRISRASSVARSASSRLLSAFLIATLLTLSSVTKRIRELGTLKALGWSQWPRRAAGDRRVAPPGTARRRGRGRSSGSPERPRSPRLAPSLKATVADREPGPGFVPGPFGQGAVEAHGDERRAGCAGEPDAHPRGGRRSPLLGGPPRRSRRKPSRGATTPRRCPPSHRLRETRP